MTARSALLRKILVALSGILVVLLVASAGVALWVVRSPLPEISGQGELDGLNGEVRILRDSRGVPTIYADSDHDLMMAQGFVHAQDRFFEMDLRRHIASGRLSELVGSSDPALAADIAVRTMGWRDVAQEEWNLLSPETRDLLEAYAAGVNRYVERQDAAELALEYTVLGLSVDLPEIEPWTPVDSIVWLKAMAWDLVANYEQELQRAQAYRAIGDIGRVEELFPDYPYDARSPIVEPGASSSGLVAENAAAREPEAAYTDSVLAAADGIEAASKALAAIPALVGRGDGVGSNSFVLSGEFTASGKPLLANDPHLLGGAPGVWHQIGLHCTARSEDCTFDVSGFSLAGMPGVVIGRNAEVAWGLTNIKSDASDFFLERISQGTSYQRGEEQVPLQRRAEVIEVAGADPLELEVLSTVHGPIVSTALPATAAASDSPMPAGSPGGGLDGYAVSLSWTALTPGLAMDAVLAMNRAADAADVTAAAALLHAPGQNIVFATNSGDIGYAAGGTVPIRDLNLAGAGASDGSWPRPGWDPAWDWQGFGLAENLPQVVNPAEGFIVAANQAVTVPGGGQFLSNDFDYGFRSQRLRSLIADSRLEGGPVTVESANGFMMDNAVPIADVLVPAVLRLEVEDAFIQEAVQELRTWRGEEHYQADADSAGAAYFSAVWANLLDLTFADELPAEIAPDGGARWAQVVLNLLTDPENPWWDDVTTVNVTETRDEVLLRALTTARYQLTNSLGKDPDRWQWGDMHVARFEHAVLSAEVAPGPLAWLLNPTPFGVSGTSGSPNATGWDAARTGDGSFHFGMTSLPSMRMVVDLGEPDSAAWVVSTGVSGHPASHNWANQIGAWKSGRYYPWPFTQTAVEAETADELVLGPAG